MKSIQSRRALSRLRNTTLRSIMEDLEIRQLLTGTLWKVTLVDNSPRTSGSEQMLHLQHGVADANDPSARHRLPI